MNDPSFDPAELPEWQRLTSPVVRDRQAQEAAEFESRIVDRLRIHAKLPPAVRTQLLTWQQDKFGERRMTLLGWHELFPDFPIFLQAGIIRNVSQTCPVSLLYSDFRHRPFVSKWLAAVRQRPELADLLPVGYVFRWPRFGGVGSPPTGLVVHNREIRTDVPGVRLTWRGPDDELLTLCPLDVLLAEIDADSTGNRWQPESRS